MPTKEKINIAAENILTIAIGVKDYNEPALHMLPAAENNANEYIKKVTLNWKPNNAEGLTVKKQYENIRKRTDGAINASTLRSEIKSFIDKSVKSKDIELIIFYYSGHGVWDTDKSKYYLMVKESTDEDLTGTAWEMSNLFDLLAENNKKVILIMDSCFSENAFNFITSGKDYYIIASSASNQTSKYPLNEENSAFTGTFIEIINQGIPGAGEYLTFSEVFEETKRKLVERKFPEPKSLNRNGAGDIIVCKNNCTVSENQAKDTFNLQGAIIRIHSALFPGREIDSNLYKNVLNNYPTIISVYLRNLLACDENASKYLNDKSFFVDFYRTLTSFLSFVIIKDLRDNQKLRQPHKELFNLWKTHQFTHSHQIEIIRTAILNYKDTLFIKNIKISIPGKLEQMEALIDENGGVNDLPTFRSLLFNLIEDLSFFKHYDLLAIRFIEVKKSFFNIKKFKHEVSHLYGEQPTSYSYEYNESREFLESDCDFLNNSVILIPKIRPTDLNDIIKGKHFLNLWPFVIDSCCNNKNAQIPELCIFIGVQGIIGVETHYTYQKLQYIKERKESITDYSMLPVFPETEEWDKYILETF